MPSIDHLVIVAGGKGTRLASLTGDLPKALVRIGGRTILEHQFEMARRAGIQNVTIFAGYQADAIRSFVGDGSQFGLAVRTEVEPEPLGNAGAVVRSLSFLPDHFFVLYCDVMCAVDLLKIGGAHLRSNADFTAVVHPNDHPHDSDLIEADSAGWIHAIHPYPHPEGQFFANLVNAALYVVRRDALAPWVGSPGKTDFVKNIMQGLLDRKARVLAYRTTEYAKDMGTPERLLKVEADWQAGKITIPSPTSLSPAVFLDRDGTLNEERGFLASSENLEILPGVGPALRKLRNAGFRLVVLTNQPVIARGEATEADLAAIHRKLEWELGKQGAFLDAIYHCPHHPDRGFPGERTDLKIPCKCRKPGTGLLEAACRDLNLDPARSWMIGDTTVDMEMARRGGLRSILVQTGSAGRDGKFPETKSAHTAADLSAAADSILSLETATPEAQKVAA